MHLEVAEKSVQELLATPEEQFKVPLYQRGYAWTTEEVDQLWEDIISNLDDEHFMGSIVINSEDNQHPEIIDGQQRLATLIILLSLIRNEYERLGSPYVGRPQQLLEADPWADAALGRYKFRLGEANWPLFRDFVLRPPSDAGFRPIEELKSLSKDVSAANIELSNALRRLNMQLAAYLDNQVGKERERRLEQLERRVSRRLKFVAIRVASVDDAFLLFETLNDRGLQLSAADLVKSHLLSRFESEKGRQHVPEAAQEWSEFIESLQGGDIGRFLRYFLLMHYTKVQSDKVFKLFKARLAAMDAESMLAQLKQAGRHYGEFVSPEALDNVPLRRVLEDLAELRATTCYVALLPARAALLDDTDAFRRFARIAEALAYRWTTIVGRNAQELESIFQEAGTEFVRRGAAGLDGATQRLTAAMPPRVQFISAFVAKAMGTHYVARYTLRRIEDALNPNSEWQLKPPAAVHIEHIMPQHLTTSWSSVLGEQAHELHAEYVHRWGNLTLLSERLNKASRDSDFNTKKSVYGKTPGPGSQVRMTQLLLRESDWGPRQIEARQRWMGEIAERLWGPAGVAAPHTIDIPPYPYEDPDDAGKQVRVLLENHETQSVELKATARTNLKTGKKRDPVVEDAFARAIVGFANAEGGTVLLGVKDDKAIQGIEIDYDSVNPPGRDSYERWVVQHIKDRVGPLLATMLRISFIQVDGHDICRVDVPPSPQPVFLTDKATNRDRFLVRMGNSVEEVSGQAMLDYQRRRWPPSSQRLGY